MSAPFTSHGVRRVILPAGFILVVACSLSIHVIMLQVLNVPYPGNLPSGGWARLPDRLLGLFGAATLYAMLPPAIIARPVWQRVGLLFLLIGMIHETLIRVPLMNIAAASRWTGWPFLDVVPSYLVVFATALAIVLAERLLSRSLLERFVTTLIIGLPIYLGLMPLLKTAFSPVLAWTSPRQGYTLYNPPYDWHIELPAYLTFVEPVIAAFLIAALVDGRLPRDRLRAIALLTLLLFAMRGQFFSMFVNIHYAGTDAVTAMLSFGQFTLESLALALVTATTWMLARRPARV